MKFTTQNCLIYSNLLEAIEKPLPILEIPYFKVKRFYYHYNTCYPHNTCYHDNTTLTITLTLQCNTKPIVYIFITGKAVISLLSYIPILPLPKLESHFSGQNNLLVQCSQHGLLTFCVLVCAHRYLYAILMCR